MFRRREIETSLLEEVEITLPPHHVLSSASSSSIPQLSPSPSTSSYTRHSVMNDLYRTSHTIKEQLDSSHTLTITTHTSQILSSTPQSDPRIPVSKSPSTLSYISTILFPTCPPSSSSSPSAIPELSRTFSDDTISPPYYSQSDFSSSHWTNVAATPPAAASAIGMAIVATATVIVHPLVFFAGAATAVWAVGVFHAVERGYEFFADGTFGELFWAEDDCRSRSDATAPLAIMEAMSPRTIGRKGHESSDNEPQSSQMTSSSSSDSHLYPTSPPSPTPTPTPTLSTPTPNRDTLLTPSQLINIHFPPLDTLIISNVRLPGLTAPEFFSVFMSDNAPYSLPSFQSTSLNDIDVQASSWTPTPHNTGGSFLSPPTDFNSLPGKLLNRDITFKTLTKSYFGTTYASAIKTQRASLVSKHLCVVESRTCLENIPFADRFYVLERWIVTAEKKTTTNKSSHNDKDDDDDNDDDDDDVMYESTLVVYASVVMTKSCTWEAQIRKKTISTLAGVLEKWKVKALDALKHAEMRRRLRERGSIGHNNINDVNVILSSSADDIVTVADSSGVSSPTCVTQVAPPVGVGDRSSKGKEDEGLVNPHVSNAQKQQQQQQQHLKQEQRLLMIHEETFKRIRTRIEEDGGVELERVQLLTAGDDSKCGNAGSMGKDYDCDKEDMATVTSKNERNDKVKRKWKQKGMTKLLKNDIFRNPYLLRVASSIRK